MRSPSILGLVTIAASAVTPSISSAQLYDDNTSPPIEVPTAPVPQGPAATTPPPPSPKPAPKPAAPPPTAAPKSAPASPSPAAEPKKEETSEPSGPKFNNEGVFKISGSKGSGLVSNDKKKAAAEPAKTAPAKTATLAKGKKGVAANVAQWPGFRLTEDGGSEVMVEFSSAPSSPTEHRAAGSVTYVFKGAHVTKSNNQNPLMTVHFNTPVLSARLVPKKGELHLVIDMRPGAKAAPSAGLRASSDGDGQQFFVKFPSGAWLPKGAENEEIGPAPTQKLKGNGAGSKTEKKSDTPPPTTTPKTESGGKTGPAP